MHPDHGIDAHFEEIFLTLGGHLLNAIHAIDRRQCRIAHHQRRHLTYADCGAFKACSPPSVTAY